MWGAKSLQSKTLQVRGYDTVFGTHKVVDGLISEYRRAA